MEFEGMIARCRRLEERAAALYRTFAAGSREDPELCALWTALAREEVGHARSLTEAAARLRPIDAIRTRLDGWEAVLVDVEHRLDEAEHLAPGASRDAQLAVALDLEMSELEAVRVTLLSLTGQDDGAPRQGDHALRLADAAIRMSEDPHVRLQAALARARAIVK
jgi:hypothetical protein